VSSSNGKKLVVLGGGPGGYPAAFLAAHLGFEVTLVDERANPGGVCLHVGCIPSKALLHVAKLITESEHSSAWGVTFEKPTIDLNKLRKYKDKVIRKLTGGLGAMSKQRNVTFLKGWGAFADSKSLKVTTDSGEQTVDFDYCIIATGSLPAMPKMFDVDPDRVLDSTTALELPDIPKKLLVVGGGYIGLEMATVYDALGSEVTVVEMASNLLPGADRDLSDILTKRVKSRFTSILTDTRVTEMTAVKNGIQVKLVGLDLKEPEQTFDRVLISVGRAPNSRNIGLENTSVKTTDRGFIEVDAQRRTTDPNIFAIGDVAGEPGLAHKATHEAPVAVNAAAGEAAAWDPACIPAVVFTDPEIAWVGLTETEALNGNVPHKVTSFPWAASGRAVSLDRTDGLTKLIVSPDGRILGVGIAGVGAGDLIAEATLAIEMGATVEDMAMTIHPHPTMSETLMEAAELHTGHSAHFMPRKK
jgi:dihydrolipoamide dehydrogenase